jgi:hypothetical protein
VAAGRGACHPPPVGNLLDSNNIEIGEFLERLHSQIDQLRVAVGLNRNLLLNGSLTRTHRAVQRRAQRNAETFAGHVHHIFFGNPGRVLQVAADWAGEIHRGSIFLNDDTRPGIAPQNDALQSLGKCRLVALRR